MQRLRKATSELGAVFYVTLGVALAFILWGVFFTSNFDSVTRTVLNSVVSNLSWFYLLVGSFFLVFVVALALSRYGKIRLGKEGDEPEFGRFSWFAMMFQAGMGPAIIFWGVAEPLAHYVNPPFDLAQPETEEAAQLGMQYSFFHWALHPWAMYAVVGMIVAYFNYRRDEPGLISPVFRSLIGDRVDDPTGKAIDILAVLAVLFGVAVALGQAGLQVTAGLSETFGTPTGTVMMLLVVGVTTVAFMASASTPLEHGIKWLSNISMLMAPVILLFFFVVGPTIVQLNTFTQGIGNYLQNILVMSFRMDSFSQDTQWLSKWTVFYWTWWISWCPFVGLFMARISRGRSIREFVVGTVVVPSVLTMIWFAAFGGAALYLAQGGGGPEIAQTAQSNPAVAMFVFIDQYPLAFVMSATTLFVLWIFFVAGADAGTVVLGEMSNGGKRDPQRWIRLSWGLLLLAIAAILLVVGGLDALRRAAVLAGLPFAAIMVFMCYSFYRFISSEAREEGPQKEEVEEPVEPAEEVASQPASSK